MMAKRKRKNRNFTAYLWNLFYCYLGNKIILMSWPFAVTKLVRVTHIGMPQSLRYCSNFCIFFLSLTCTMVVPSKMKALLSILAGLACTLDNLSAFLTTGTDSPVKAHSFIKALPYKMIPSNGIFTGSLMNTTSPGTTSTDDICLIMPSLRTFIGIS